MLTKHDLIGWIAKGEKSPNDFKIGTEHEKFAFYKETLKPVPYEGERGIKALLEGLKTLFGWKPVEDNGALIGLTDPISKGAISLEPGGQFELSGAPLTHLHQTCREVHTHLAQIRKVAEPLGIHFLGLGVAPVWTLEEMPIMPKSRYKIMKNYMPKVGHRGLDMMFRTTTIQVNLDFENERDMAKKMRVATALQPLATALFANSPFINGTPSSTLSERSNIWQDTDGARSGILPFIFEDHFTYESYVNWALDVPMYFIRRAGHYHDAAGASFKDFIKGKIKGLEGEKAGIDDWVDHLSTLFPEVRLKRFLEMRGADGGPWRRICALPAFWVGILYHQQSLEAAFDLIKSWSYEEVVEMHKGVAKQGLSFPHRDKTLLEIGHAVLKISEAGLKARAFFDQHGQDETIFIEALQEQLITGRTPAQELLDRYNGPWQKSLKPIYTEYCF